MGWPKRHTRRCGYYYKIIRIFQTLNCPIIENERRFHSGLEPIWSAHEIEVFKKISEDLAELYNNRYVEYHRMTSLEKGLTPPIMESTTKYKLKL